MSDAFSADPFSDQPPPDLIEEKGYRLGADGVWRNKDGYWLKRQTNGTTTWLEREPLVEAEPDNIGFTRETVQHQGRVYTREVDGRWRNEFGSELRRLDDGPGWTVDLPPPAWIPDRLSKWDGVAISERLWFMEEWVPRGQCTGIYGIPGARKSLWILQAMIAAAFGREFCGEQLEHSTTLGLFCEDEDEEIARRARAILRKFNRRFGDSELDGCQYKSLVGADLTEFLIFTRAGTPLWSPAWHNFETHVMDLRPSLVALDVVPDFFGGNENIRREVHTFVRGLDGLAQRSRTAILFSAHPSVRGIATRSLASGSTGWEGKVRARLTLHDPALMDEAEDSDTPDRLPVANRPSNDRILTRVKANYAEQGEEIMLEIEDNAIFRLKGGVVVSQLDNLAVEAKYLELLAKIGREGRWVSESFRATDKYAPRVFADHPDSGGITFKQFVKAQKRLLGVRIKVGEVRDAAGRKQVGLVVIG